MPEYNITDVQADLVSNADFEEVASLSKAKAFVTAAKRWLILRPGTASNQSSSLSMNVGQVESMMKRAVAYVAANDRTSSGTSSVRFLSVKDDFR